MWFSHFFFFFKVTLKSYFILFHGWFLIGKMNVTANWLTKRAQQSDYRITVTRHEKPSLELSVSVVHKTPQTFQTAATAAGCHTEVECKSLLLKIPCTSDIDSVVPELDTVSPQGLALMVPQGAMKASKEKKQVTVLHSYDCVWQHDTITLRVLHSLAVTNRSVIGLRPIQ